MFLLYCICIVAPSQYLFYVPTLKYRKANETSTQTSGELFAKESGEIVNLWRQKLVQLQTQMWI